MDIGSGAYSLRGPVHNSRTRKQRNHAAEGRQRHRERYVATRQHGEHVAGTAARTARNEHDAQKEQRLDVKYRPYGPSDERQEHNLTNQSGQQGLRTVDKKAEVVGLQRQAQVEHQQRQNGQNNEYRVHILILFKFRILNFQR